MSIQRGAQGRDIDLRASQRRIEIGYGSTPGLAGAIVAGRSHGGHFVLQGRDLCVQPGQAIATGAVVATGEFALRIERSHLADDDSDDALELAECRSLLALVLFGYGATIPSGETQYFLQCA
jgi:hypothetical protein